ncbi:MAG: GTPase HflX [Desulfobacterales bacterium]|jgi:GTP-binding protein HflX
MKRVHGHTTGLKPDQIKRLERLYRRRVPPQSILSYELAKDMGRLSRETGRQIGLLIDRTGRVATVLVGDSQKIVIPDLSDYRVAPGRLRGLRCIHTHLDREPLTKDDLTDLALLRLDLMAAVTVSDQGIPDHILAAHVLPGERGLTSHRLLDPILPSQPDIGCLSLIHALESELAQRIKVQAAGKGSEQALLVSVATTSRKEALASLQELRELAITGGITIIDSILQMRQRADSRFLMGSGKLKDLAIEALQKNATLVIFDQELNPSQIRSITEQIELKVIDRTQLILDIFAQRARSREGKLQVELAQLKYLLPRLVTKNTAMSRLTGGIGGRGPGETKLEINRRRVRERITRLEKSLRSVQSHRSRQRSRREKRRLPVVSIIGYTNAGKSTLLNTLTRSDVSAENRLFATLDPSSRRLKFPRDMEVIITDTVGFIRDLPKELMVAFRATLEELEAADLLLHVIDISTPNAEQHIQSVERILEDLHLDHIPCIRVLNKSDRVTSEALSPIQRRLKGTPVSALNRRTLAPLLIQMESILTGLNLTPAWPSGTVTTDAP